MLRINEKSAYVYRPDTTQELFDVIKLYLYDQVVLEKFITEMIVNNYINLYNELFNKYKNI